MKFRLTRYLAACAGALIAASAHAQEIRTITLSSSGTALINATNAMTDGVARISVRDEDLDAVLKTLQVRDPEGGSVRLGLAGPSRAAAAFDGLPYAPENLSSPEAFLRALRGRPVEVSSWSSSVTGRVTGVSSESCDEAPCSFVTLMTDAGVKRVRLSRDATVTPMNPEDLENLRRATRALAALDGADRVNLDIESSVAKDRDVNLTLIQDAQPWRTAWRGTSRGDDLRLTGWAIVENRSGWAWDDVELTLATGAVQTLSPEIYDPSGAPRNPVSKRNDLMEMARDNQAESLRASAVSASTAPAPVMKQSRSFSRYTLPDPVTLAPGEMAVLPFITEDLENARGLRYRGGSGAQHPDIVLTIKNPLPLRLPGGVLTLYEDARGHAGDARVPEIPAGGEETVRFAKDTAIEVREDRNMNEIVRNVSVSDGIVRVTETLRRITRYRVTGAAEAARTVEIQHPTRSNWSVRTPRGERSADYVSWKIDVGKDEEEKLEVVEESPRVNSVRIGDLENTKLLRWSRSAPDPKVRRKLEEVARFRRAIAENERLIDVLEDRRERLISDQKRLLDMVDTLGTSGSTGRERVERIDDLESRITDVQERAESVRSDIDDQRDRIRTVIGRG